MYMAAQVLGFGKPDPTAIYNLSDEQLEQVKQKLIALKPNIRKLWTTGGELTNLFQNHEVIAAMGWPLVTNQLRKSGIPIEEEIPSEGTTGWIDHLMITSSSDNKELAYQLLNYLISAQAQKQLSDVTGYIPANPQAAAADDLGPAPQPAPGRPRYLPAATSFSGKTCPGAPSTPRFGTK